MLVDGQTVVDMAGIVLCPSSFERYWISILDGRITVGKGEPGNHVLYEWSDTNPNCKVKYVGLSSWDKHVGYRNIRVLPPARVIGTSLSSHLDLQGVSGGLAPFLESAEFADMQFVVGPARQVVPAHRVLLASWCTRFAVSSEDVIWLPSVDYSVLHSFLQYMYTGRTQVCESELVPLQELAEEFGLKILASQCEELKMAFTGEEDYGAKVAQLDPKVELIYNSSVAFLEKRPAFPINLPFDGSRLMQLLETGEFSDVDIIVESHGKVFQAHKLVLSAWSVPFRKMFTNGMCESSIGEVVIRDVSPELLMVMLHFMYCGHLELDEKDNAGCLLLPLLLLADQFAIELLQQECCVSLLDCLTEDSACAILQVAASMPSCQVLRDACEECCARHFDYCIVPPAAEFRGLEVSCLLRILQHPDLCVESEEKVLDAVMLWAANRDEIHGWDDANCHANNLEQDHLFGQREEDLESLLPLVHFPFISLPVLEMLQNSDLCTLSKLIPSLKKLATEAIEYLSQDLTSSYQQKGFCKSLGLRTQGRMVKFPQNNQRFSRRPSTYKELLYICDGDCNGVFYYTGTSYGVHPWMNPALIKKLVVSASSPPSRFTDPKALVSRNYQGTSIAGPCNEGGGTSAWWKVDLGEDHELICNYYTVRHDGSSNFMRTWSLQVKLFFLF
ncbi:hypothetical protein CY35_10G016000 [Sphagnum magellanicum]|nr:hypothetical protein CY35_10G016000 [Sphagnum magellanicum]